MDCQHADLRYGEVEHIKIRTKNGAHEEIKRSVSKGVGFRVLASGAFGFSATWDLSEESLLGCLQQAYAMAKEFSKIRHAEVELIAAKPVKASWKTPVLKDPWDLSLKEMTAPVVEAERKLKSRAWVESASSVLDFTRKRSLLVTREGSWIDQMIYRSGGWIHAEACVKNPGPKNGFRERIKRSWPGSCGPYKGQGFEMIEDLDFTLNASRIAEELRELRQSPEAPSGKFDLILKGSILALQMHETFGHAAESDRLYGYEDNFGGRTFLNPGLVGSFQVAAPCVHLTSDGTLGRGAGAGSVAYDDEGVKAKPSDLVRRGIFKEFLTSRETAYFLNQPAASANMIAEDWSHYPLIRMTNMNLLPGKGTLKQMIADTEDGFMLDNESSWSVDQMRLDFHIGAEAGYLIRNGKIQGMVRFPHYHGNSLDFWRSCDWVAGKREWDYWGFADCGKGGPYQQAFTGHGLSPARFRGVEFGRD